MATMALPHVLDLTPSATDPYGVVQLLCLPTAGLRHDRLLVAFLREIQVWDIAPQGTERSMVYAFYAPSMLRQVWAGPSDDEILARMADDIVMSATREAWISLLGGMRNPRNGFHEVCRFGAFEDTIVLGHERQVVRAFADTNSGLGGITHQWLDLPRESRCTQLGATEPPVGLLPLRVRAVRLT